MGHSVCRAANSHLLIANLWRWFIHHVGSAAARAACRLAEVPDLDAAGDRPPVQKSSNRPLNVELLQVQKGRRGQAALLLFVVPIRRRFQSVVAVPPTIIITSTAIKVVARLALPLPSTVRLRKVRPEMSTEHQLGFLLYLEPDPRVSPPTHVFRARRRDVPIFGADPFHQFLTTVAVAVNGVLATGAISQSKRMPRTKTPFTPKQMKCP